MIFQFTYEDKKYQYDDGRMGLGEARWVKQETGLVGMAFFEAARALDPDAILCILVMAMRRAGEVVDVEDIYADDDNGYYKLITSLEVLEATEPVATPAPKTRTKKASEG